MQLAELQATCNSKNVTSKDIRLNFAMVMDVNETTAKLMPLKLEMTLI